MATTLNKASTWTNSDGLIVGFGPAKPVKEGSVERSQGQPKVAAVVFTYDDSSSVNVPIPAGSRILDVRLKVIDAFTGGTSLTVGDGGSAVGFITATAGATANLTAGASINPDGAYAFATTDTTATELKTYASADTIDLAVNGTFTAGKGVLEVTYMA